ncbi:DUF3472 domain-containing protein [Daejeonella sp.]|jgi:hypothetical protein|uniref:DUF3472 domain-containing protein n=1 Tax=Daejeonella sp. TaxID=2805397 RepID=UPI00378377C5
MMKKLVIISFIVLLSAITYAQTFKAMIPLGGNAYVSKGAKITDAGLVEWFDKEAITSIYFRVSKPQVLNVSLLVRVPEGESVLRIKAGGKSFEKKISNIQFDTIAIGNIDVKTAGHVKIDIQGLKKTHSYFAEISNLLISGENGDQDLVYVKKGSSFHFGRRGPSVHLRYDIPPNIKSEVKWFYNEIKVPAKSDVIGSYYMANGFGEGYFGMQVNSPTERRILFSVWSPFVTDDPKSIPDSMKIVLLKKGPTVKTGEFGNEGSGGQSYMVFPWKIEQSYAFLLGVKPDFKNKTTEYTAYFKDPEQGKWFLIARFKRPQKATNLTNLYSFLENFATTTGNTSRMGYYQNQWIMDSVGQWYELTSAKFTADATARGNYRKDYAGGVKGNKFFMKNAGFFNEFTSMDQFFKRELMGVKPDIDFDALEKL